MTETLSILHVCPRPNFSGLEAYAFSLALDQKARGLNVAMFVLPNSPLYEKCLNAGIQTLTSSISNEVGSRQIFHLHSTQDLSVVLPSLIKAKFFKKPRPKVILQTHILISHTKKDPIHFFEYLFVDEMWCSSTPAKNLLEKYIPITKDKIKIIRYGRDIEKIQSRFMGRSDARKVLGLTADAIAVGLVSRIDKQKGIREFLEGAIPILKLQPRLNLVFIGGRTENDPEASLYADDIEKFHKSLPPEIAKRIHFKGNMADSYQYMPALDLYALPSYKECFALSLLEAQLAGLPVLGTASGGTPDIVIENRTGYLFEPESSESAGEALARALKSQDQWPEYGNRASKRVMKEFNFELVSGSIIENYRAISKT